IGGGVMGASTLYHLAKRGLNAVLLEKEPFFGQGATGRCAGGIRYQFATEINIRLSLLSLPMLDRFEEEIGQPIDRRYCGYLFMLTREEDVATFKHNVALQHSLGVMTEWLSGDEVRRRIPLIRCDDALAGTFNGHDGLCDPNSVVMGYINAARRLGAKAVEGIEVAAIKTAGGKVVGVETNRGTVSTDVVVNAAGPWSAPISRTAGIDLPVQPVRRQWLTTTPLPAVPPNFPFVIDFAQSLYFHREGDGLLLGMSNLNEKPGFDQSVDEEFELINLEAATKRMPLLEKAGLASHLAGLYEVTPDAHPIIGRVPALDGYFVVTGFSGHGFMHGPVSGLLMSEEILDGKAHTLDISSLRYSRFEEGQLIREYNVI
ncbi:MAG TPA: FAD-binding oxidoreductase, partial [Anaerolineales bacterium]|nr:FAD-binding oxidoreductase [Anaerolineales bacterium]